MGKPTPTSLTIEPSRAAHSRPTRPALTTYIDLQNLPWGHRKGSLYAATQARNSCRGIVARTTLSTLNVESDGCNPSWNGK